MVLADRQPERRAARLWDSSRGKAFAEVRSVLAAMASGYERCMYCEDSLGTAIEHFWPKSRYPRRAFDWNNFLLACSHCNSNQKRDEFPLDPRHRPLLVDPTAEDPERHILLTPTTGKYVARTAKGRHSVRTFGLARPMLEHARADAWLSLTALIVLYADHHRRRDPRQAALVARAIMRHPFSAVLHALLLAADGPGRRLIDRKCLQALARHPEVRQWTAADTPPAEVFRTPPSVVRRRRPRQS